MKLLTRIIESIVDLVGGQLTGWLVCLMMLLVVFEAFMRYVIHQPPMLSDELGGYMLVAISFLGMAYTFKENGHVRVTFLVDKLPKSVSRWLRLLTLIFLFIFSLLLSKASYDYLAFSFKIGMRSATWLHLPLQWVQMTLVIGFVLLSLLLIVRIVKTVSDVAVQNESRRDVRSNHW